jgi:hypothetical protein
MMAQQSPPAPAPSPGEDDAPGRRRRCDDAAAPEGSLADLLAQLRQARIMEIRAIERYLGLKPAKPERY